MPENISEEDQSGMPKSIDFDALSYMCFEGGGGKGTVYQGVVESMESLHDKKFVSRHTLKTELKEFYGSDVPLFPLLLKPSERKFKGVSGTSAGAITAFFLSLGLNLKEIKEIFEKTHEVKVDAMFSRAKTIPINSFEGFLGMANVKGVRQVKNNKPSAIQHEAGNGILHSVVNWLGAAAPLIRGLIPRSKKKSMYFFQRLLSRSGDMGGPSQYVNSLLGNRGIFAGFEVRTFFTKILKEKLLARLAEYSIDPFATSTIDIADSKSGLYINELKQSIADKILNDKAGEINFREFFFLTGVDLVVSSTNMSRGRTFYFSAYHTPDFPVIEAVGMSMNFPFVFKPVYVDSDVISDGVAQVRAKDPAVAVYYKDYNKIIRGLYVDGGVLQNFPLHAFDHWRSLHQTAAEGLFLAYINDPSNRDLKVSCQVPFGNYRFTKSIVGFNLTSTRPNVLLKTSSVFPNSSINAAGWLGQLMDVFMFPGSEGQVQSKDEYDQVIDVPVYIENPKWEDTKINERGYKEEATLYEISLLDFATPALDKTRGLTIRGNFKAQVIQQAVKIVVQRFISILVLLVTFNSIVAGQADFGKNYRHSCLIDGWMYNIDSIQVEHFYVLSKYGVRPGLPRYVISKNDLTERGSRYRFPELQSNILNSQYLYKKRPITGYVAKLDSDGRLFFWGKVVNGQLADTGIFANGWLRQKKGSSFRYIKPSSPLVMLALQDQLDTSSIRFISGSSASAVTYTDENSKEYCWLSKGHDKSATLLRESSNNWKVIDYEGYNQHQRVTYGMMSRPVPHTVYSVDDSIGIYIVSSNALFNDQLSTGGYRILRAPVNYFVEADGTILSVIIANDSQYDGLIGYKNLGRKTKNGHVILEHRSATGNILTFEASNFKMFQPITIIGDNVWDLLNGNWEL